MGPKTIRIGTITAVALLAAAARAADARGPGVIAQPDWLLQPTGEDVARNYPDLARRIGASGRAAIVCRVDGQGALTDCAVAEEAPKDIGFGAMALRLARSYRMRPMSRDGAPVAGGTVRLPMAFTLEQRLGEGDGGVNPRAPDPVAASMDLGRRLADITNSVENVIGRFDQMALDVESAPSPDVPLSSRRVIADAFRRAVRKNAADIREAYARAYADAFSPEELAQIVAFETSSAGRVLRSNANDRDAATLLARNFIQRVMKRTREEFCKTWDCHLPAGLVIAHGDATIDNPQWSHEPTESQIQAAAPLNAGLGLTGFVRLRCKVADLGLLDACEVAAEAPAGLGYGAAALSLTHSYQVAPALVPQGPAKGTATVRITFMPRALPGDAQVPPHSSEGALALARQLADGDRRVPDFHERMAQRFREVLQAQSRVVSPEAYERLEAAFAVAVADASDAWTEERASLIAAQLSEDEIAQGVAFIDTPAARAWWQRSILLSRNVDREISPLQARIAGDVRAEFCRDNNCVN
jgi:TonB family protein